MQVRPARETFVRTGSRLMDTRGREVGNEGASEGDGAVREGVWDDEDEDDGLESRHVEVSEGAPCWGRR